MGGDLRSRAERRKFEGVGKAVPVPRKSAGLPAEAPRPAQDWEARRAERAARHRGVEAEAGDSDAVVLPRRRGRPPLAEGIMTDVTLRVPVETLSDAEVLVRFAHQWPEFAGTGPTRAGVLKLAMSMGLQQLRERQAERESAPERPAQGWSKAFWPNASAWPSVRKSAALGGEPVTAEHLSSVIEGLIVQQRRQEVEMVVWRRQLETQMAQLRAERGVVQGVQAKDR